MTPDAIVQMYMQIRHMPGDGSKVRHQTHWDRRSKHCLLSHYIH